MALLRGRTLAGSVLACVVLAGCQLVLGFEDHVPFPAGSGGQGGAGGGVVGGAPSGFGDPEEIASGLGQLDAVAISGSDVFVLERTASGHRIQRSRAGVLQVLASDLLEARGLVTAGREVFTTHGPLDSFDFECHVSAFSDQDRRDVLTETCDGENSYFAVAVDGDTLAATFLELQGNDHSDVRVGPLSGSPNGGSLIGLGEDEEEGIPSVAIAGGTFYWVDSELDDVMTSEGRQLQNFVGPPGDSVNTLAEGLSVATELAVAGGKVYVARNGEVTVVDDSGDASELAEADEPRGLAADSAIVVWAEVDQVRAHLVDADETLTLDEPSDEPTDVALGPSFIVYVTAGGRIVQIPRM